MYRSILGILEEVSVTLVWHCMPLMRLSYEIYARHYMYALYIQHNELKWFQPPNSFATMYCNIYIYSRHSSLQSSKAPTIFLYAKHTYLYFGRQMQKDIRLDPHAHMYATDIHTNTQRNTNIFGRIVNRPRTYRINDICHRFSFFFCFCLSLPISSCVYLRLPSPSPLPLPFICSTGLLCLLCYLMYRIHIYVAWIFGLVTWPMSHGMWCGYESIDYFSLRICQSYILETESHNAHTLTHTYQRRIETEWQWQFQWEDEKSKQ